jgi:hypothetical protein
MLPTPVYYLFLLACCAYVALRGAAPEKIGAAIILVGSILSTVALTSPARRFTTVEVGVLLVDIAAFVALLVLSLRAERFWPLWVTALQSIATVAHAVKLIESDLIRAVYAIVMGLWTYPVLLIIVFGTWNHRRRLAKFGVDKSWSSSSGRSETPPPNGPIG